MAARSGAWTWTGAILLGVAAVGAGVLVRTQPELDRPAPPAAGRPSTPPAALRQPLRTAPDDLVESGASAAAKSVDPKPARLSSSTGTALVKSTATLRYWRVDPREVQAVELLRDDAFPELVLSVSFGGGLRVDHPSALRLGVVRDLEEGDIVRAINGIPIRDEIQFRLLAGRLWRKTGVIQATLDRAGSPVLITYQQSDSPPPPATFR